MREPIAIVGMACRFPGDVDSLDDLHALIRERRSAIRDIPADRWDVDAFFHPDFRKLGRIHVRKLGWLSDVDKFDAAFFGISPNEARRMDPQQRHVLEVAYRAIEDAGVPLEQLAGQPVAVVIGAGASDYGCLVRVAGERDNIGAASNPGSALSIVSNRVSYLFDLRGPSFTVDTACSSALTALHHACEAIWSGVATAAIAGGANSILSPETTMGFSKGGYLSPDHECRAFSDDANGYVRSEGAAAVLLKPLAAARAAGDRIHAVIRGTWINQDGRTQGMTVPSVVAQEDLLRSALRVAGVAAADVAYVEAHGTGTPAGDPIEATAIGKVVGRASGRAEPCVIGSVKTNLGHMECAAGMGGLFKLVLTLARREILPNINFRAPNPAIDLDALGIAIATEPRALPASGPVIGCVNSFGFGGANGHAVLETAPEREPEPAPEPGPHPFVLSARSASALRTAAADLAAHVRKMSDLHAVSRALLARRSRYEHRLGVVAADPSALATALDAFAAEGSGAITARVPDGHAEPVVFVYTGQGAQWFAMGRTLLQRDPAFGAAIDRIGGMLAAHGWLGGAPGALRAELGRSRETSRMSETRIAQPCIFALQVAVTEQLAARGIRPAAVVGHSIGELAAAVAAGALAVDEAARIVYWRSECQAAAEGAGAMLAVGLTEAAARALGAGTDVDVAAINGPSATTLAGTTAAIAAVEAQLVAAGTFVRRLDVSVPFHSRLMDPIEADFRARLGAVRISPPSLPFYSTVTGTLHAEPLGVDYWWANIRQPVRYHRALRALLAARLACFAEIGPHPALMHGSVDTIRAAGARATWVPTLRRDGDDLVELATATATLIVHGVREVATGAVPHVALPGHPFERERFWLETEASRRARTTPATARHPHLGALERSVHAPDIFGVELALDPRVETYLGDHRAQDHIVFPAAGQLELVLAAAREVYASEAFVVEDLEFKRPIVLADDDTRLARHRLEVYSDDGHFLIVSNAGTPDAPWVEHTRGRLRRSTPPPARTVDVAALTARIADEVAQPAFYRACETVGLALGPTFKNLGAFRRTADGRELLCHVDLLGLDAVEAARFILHPALLDATFHSMVPIDPDRATQRLYLPFRLGRVRFWGEPPRGPFWSHARVTRQTADELISELELFDASGRVFATFEGQVARHVRGATSGAGAAAVLYDHAWHALAVDPQSPRPPRSLAGQRWLIATVPHALRSCERALAAAGAEVIRVIAGDRFERREPNLFAIRPGVRADATALAAALSGTVTGLVHAWSLDVPADALPTAALALGAASIGDLTAALRFDEAWLVTRASLTGAAVAGVGRVLMSEQPRLAITIAHASAPAELDVLAAAIVAGPAEAELAFCGDTRLARTLTRHDAAIADHAFPIATAAVRAIVRSPGVLDSVAFEEFAPRELAPNDVEVAVAAVGLNFRDVVAAMNLLPEQAWEGGLVSGHQMGIDAAGTVVRIGVGVRHVAAGDRVVGLFPHALATRAVTHELHVVKLPPGVSATQAAALPTPYATAEVALHELARVRAGETVLIHAAAGGVGTVAVQLALAAGARVIATTSSDDKRAFLARLGVQHIFNSRTAEFGDAIMALTDGGGVDIVLNSLSGQAMTESFRVLRPFGRFVEIGKTDIYRNRQLALRQLGENKSYFCLDANRIYRTPSADNAARIARSLTAVETGLIRELPITTFALADARAALRALAQGRQIGRVVVEVPTTGTITATPSTELRLAGDGVHLVTGGCAGFGLALAEWLVSRGARRLVLVGRRGVPSAVEGKQVAALAARGVDVVVLRGDVSARAEVDALISEATARGRLAGVWHAAMVLDDGALDALDPERYARVLAPKADSAVHLDRATAGLALDHFVMLSSISSVIGTPGQGSYAAANAVLDELAASRVARGLPALAINWGVIEDVGVVARASATQRAKILNHGIRAMSSARAFELLERALVGGAPSGRIVIADLDPKLLGRLGGAARRFDPSLLAATESRTRGGDSLRDRVLALPAVERAPALSAALGQLVSSIAGLGADKLDPESALSRYGFDSLMVAQLQTWIDEQLGLSVAMVRLLRGPSVVELAGELIAQLTADPARGDHASALIQPLRAVAAPRAHVICFPPMAIAGDAFGALADALPADLGVHVAQLPTFADPRAELLLQPEDDQLAALADEIVAAAAGAPVALYGHSMGGYIALGVARVLAARGQPAALVAIGAVPVPELPRGLARDVAAPDDITPEMAEAAIARFGAKPMRRSIELARRDLWLTAHSRPADARATDGPTLLIAGASDPLATIDKLPAEARRALGYADADVRTVAGGHLFLFEAAACAELAALLDSYGRLAR